MILNPTRTYEEELRRASDYANVGETNLAKRREDAKSSWRYRRPNSKQGDKSVRRQKDLLLPIPR